MSESLLARRLSRRALLALDALAAAGYTLVQLGIVSAQHGTAPAAVMPGWVAVVLVVAGVLPVAVRRLAPVPVFATVLAVDVVAVLGGLPVASLLPAAFALYLVGTTRSGRRVPTVAIGVVSGLGLLLGMLAGSPTPVQDWVGTLLVGLAAVGGAWTVGQAVRERRAYAARSVGQLAGRAVSEERLRIARELHDVVAHSMGIITVKAAVANHVLRTRPEEVTDALRVIETTSRDALTEMRHLLGVLRTDPTGDPTANPTGGDGGPDGLRPAPGLAGLPELADRAALAGVRVTVRVRAPDPQPQGIQLAAYRIVQEALTNVIRHAAPARCRVSVTAGPGALRVEVTDDGPGHRTLTGPAAGAGPGHGLVGMRERVAVYGGTFHAGPRPGGGFGVLATLPYDDAPRTPPEGDR